MPIFKGKVYPKEVNWQGTKVYFKNNKPYFDFETKSVEIRSGVAISFDFALEKAIFEETINLIVSGDL